MKHLQRSDDPPAHSWNAVPLVRDRNGVEWEVGAAQRHPQRVRARLEQAVDHWIERARQMPIITRVKTPIPRPTVVYDLRGSVAGMAVSLREQPGPPQQWMHVHPELLMRYPIQMIQQTTPHEIAHLVVDWYLPRTREHHGAEWCAVMRYFGRPPLPYHEMEGQRRSIAVEPPPQRRLAL
ncbi:SprT-like family protein [Hydrocarboniphaga daqingensis]|jgi:predicted SprT family Zn-dependent metalloprotease|uniref:SprT-like family protein n=1 Tax=Hydrocarboniphaga daqingensis TaxID=490188 RepID=A0A1M5R1I9_9GAMM|nr:SprT-like domain-containing protein [Hydrocarboniphaga daqingensis]SHH20255.1 SprT-like family protein [Hydrocarboniphaga daqingensis]